MSPAPSTSVLSRLGWMLLLWLAGLGVVGTVAVLIRFWLKA